MGRMKRPGTQNREDSRITQNATGPNANKTRPRGKAKVAREISEGRKAARGLNKNGTPKTGAAHK